MNKHTNLKISRNPKTVKPKYSIGDIVWFIEDNLLQCEEIKGVILTNSIYSIYRYYTECGGDVDYEVPETWTNECYIYPTKEDLINSL